MSIIITFSAGWCMDISKTSFSPPFEDWELLLFNINPHIFIGPGQYELKDGSARGGLMTTREQRFKSSRNENPGPGSYEVCVWFWRMDLEIKKNLKKKIIIIIVTMIKQTLLKALKFVRLQKLSLVNVPFGLF